MLALGWFFFTLSPVECGETPIPAIATVVNLNLEMEDIFFYVTLTLVLLIVALFIVLDFSRNQEMSNPMTFERMRDPRFLFDCLCLILLIIVTAPLSLSLCDCRTGSPALGVGLHAEVPPETGVPQGAPVQIPVPAEVPQLNQPLMSDDYRSGELQQRLRIYFIGRNSWSDLSQFVFLLEKQMQLEIHIEAALVHDGYQPRDILRNRLDIRGILFNHPTRGVPLSERTLDNYLSEIARNGTRQSIPYSRVVRAIRNFDLTL